MKPNARFPLVPLPYTLRTQAMPNEIIMNYETGDLYLTKSDPAATGDARFINIADAVAEQLRKSGAPADNMTVTIPSPTPGEPPITVTLAASITDLFAKLKDKVGFAAGSKPIAGNVVTIGANGDLVDSGKDPTEMGIKNIASDTKDGLMSKEMQLKLKNIEAEANKYIHPATHPASIITEDITHRFTTDAEKVLYKDKYNKSEIDNKLSALETNIDWKESVANFAAIATTYPNPVDGWTVNVNDTDITYRFNGTAWIAISANAIPKATTDLDGLMTKELVSELKGIPTLLAKKMNLLPVSAAGKIVTSDANGNLINLETKVEDTIIEDYIWSNSTNMNSIRRNHSSVGITNNSMVMGGSNGSYLNTTEVYNGSIWSNSTNMNTSRYMHSSVGITNNSMVMGGYNDNGIINTTEVYNGSIWSNSTNMNSIRHSHSSVGISNNSMVMGGNNGSYLNTTEVYNGSIWSNSTNMNSKRQYISSVGIINNCMVMGGINTTYLNTTEVYNGSIWSNSTNMNSIRSSLSSVGITNNSMVMGGSNNGRRLNTTEVYNGTIWSNSTNMNSIRQYHSSVGITNNSMVMGGDNDSILNTTEVCTSNNTASSSYRGILNQICIINNDFISKKSTDTFSTGPNMTYYTKNNAANGVLKYAMTNGGDNSSSNSIFNGITWTSSAAIPASKSFHQSVGPVNDALIFSGNTATSYLFNGAVWSSGVSVPGTASKQGYGAVGVSKACIHIGYTGTTNENKIFDGIAWKVAPTSLAERHSLSATGNMNAATIIGGNILATEVFNGAVWSTGPNVLIATTAQSAVGNNNNARRICGFNGTKSLSATEKIISGVWTASPSMANERKDHASTGGTDGSITVGGDINGSRSNSTEFIIHAYTNTLDGINSAFESVYNAINIMNVTGVDTAQLDTLSTNLTNQITAVETRLDDKMKTIIGKIPNIAILANGWTYNSSVSKYLYKINNAAITADRVVNVNFPLNVQEMASFFGIASITQSYAGYVEIYSDLKPTMDMVVSLVVE